MRCDGCGARNALGNDMCRYCGSAMTAWPTANIPEVVQNAREDLHERLADIDAVETLTPANKRLLSRIVGGITLALLMFGMVVHDAHAKRLQHEDVWNRAWCTQVGGTAEAYNKGGTRTDCLTSKYAVEADFASKWAEAIGQSALYGVLTKRRPAILLIIEEEKDCRFIPRLQIALDRTYVQIDVTTFYKIDLFITGVRSAYEGCPHAEKFVYPHEPQKPPSR